jgi:hypothetical protein
MKVEQLIVSYLTLHKRVGIQSIGHFIYEGTASESSETQQNDLSANRVQFVCNKQEPNDEGLIAFILQETGKIKPLATSDLESFSILGQQFLNIGKPMSIRTLGYLTKNQIGEYVFTQGDFIPERQELNRENKQTQSLKKNKDTPSRIDFGSFKKKKEYSKKWIPILIIVILIGLMGLVVFIFSRYNNSEKPLETENKEAAVAPTNTKPAAIAKTDTTSSLTKDSTLLPQNNVFFVVVRTYSDSLSAQRGFIRLNVLPFGKEIKLINIDSSHYQIALPVKGNIADSIRIKDSVKAIFGKIAFVRTQ